MIKDLFADERLKGNVSFTYQQCYKDQTRCYGKFSGGLFFEHVQVQPASFFLLTRPPPLILSPLPLW